LLRPLDLSDILDTTFNIYRSRVALFAGIAVLLSLPALVTAWLGGTFDFWGYAFSQLTEPGTGGGAPPRSNPIFTILGWLLALVLSPFTTAALVRLAADTVFGQPATVRSVLGYVLRRYLPLLAITFVGAVLSLTIFLLPLFVWLAVRLVAAVPAMVAEGIGPIAGIERSWRLVEGRWWRTLLVVSLLYLLQTACSYGLIPLFGVIAGLLPGLNGTLRGGLVLVGVQLAAALVTPLWAIGTFVIYVDFRVRREALDLDQMARRAAQAQPGQPA
jgi:hypothetical protein